jgi:hypothetical protein
VRCADERDLHAAPLSLWSPAYPGIPTLDESGFPGFDMDDWNCLFAAEGAPRGRDESISITALPNSIRHAGYPNQVIFTFASPPCRMPAAVVENPAIGQSCRSPAPQNGV